MVLVARRARVADGARVSVADGARVNVADVEEDGLPRVVSDNVDGRVGNDKERSDTTMETPSELASS